VQPFRLPRRAWCLRVMQRGLPRAEQWDGMGELYRAVWRVSGRDQIALILLSLVVAALAAVPLEFQQLAVNSLVDYGNVFRLAWLCGGFLGAVLLSAGAKFLLGLRLALVGERVVRLIRERLYTNHVAQAAGDSADGAHGTLVTMLAAEAEVVGAFAGSAISTPVVQLGTLLSVIGFIAVSQPWLGLLALGVVLPQAAIVLALQGRINQRVKERVQVLRDTSGRIAAGGVVQPAVLAGFRSIYETRRRIFRLKLSSKFVLGTISALGKVGILFLGGWLVLEGRSDVGTVVARAESDQSGS
jgi:ABC-type bacteriocin/lantibiotic exporter with double-glycine peptidase domain